MWRSAADEPLGAEFTVGSAATGLVGSAWTDTVPASATASVTLVIMVFVISYLL
jgi:hypothetical protein